MAPINLERGFLNVWNTNPSGDNILDCLLLLLKYFLNKSRLPYHDFKPSTEYVTLAGVWHVTLPTTGELINEPLFPTCLRLSYLHSLGRQDLPAETPSQLSAEVGNSINCFVAVMEMCIREESIHFTSHWLMTELLISNIKYEWLNSSPISLDKMHQRRRGLPKSHDESNSYFSSSKVGVPNSL